MDNIEIVMGGVELTFKVEFEHDHDAGIPWENSEGNGPVTEWTSRDKRPGELILNKDRTSRRYYDFQAACKMALAEGWDAKPYNTEGHETKRQQAAKAARANYEYLRAWCNDEWSYVGVIVTLLDTEGNETEVTDSLWGVETSGDYHHDIAKQLVDELAHGMGTRWDVVTIAKTTYGYLKG